MIAARLSRCYAAAATMRHIRYAYRCDDPVTRLCYDSEFYYGALLCRYVKQAAHTRRASAKERCYTRYDIIVDAIQERYAAVTALRYTARMNIAMLLYVMPRLPMMERARERVTIDMPMMIFHHDAGL